MSSFATLDESSSAAASSTSASSAVSSSSSTAASPAGGDHDAVKKAGPKELGKSEISGAVFNLANAVRGRGGALLPRNLGAAARSQHSRAHAWHTHTLDYWRGRGRHALRAQACGLLRRRVPDHPGGLLQRLHAAPAHHAVAQDQVQVLRGPHDDAVWAQGLPLCGGRHGHLCLRRHGGVPHGHWCVARAPRPAARAAAAPAHSLSHHTPRLPTPSPAASLP